MTQAWKAGKRHDGNETAPETVLGLKWMSADGDTGMLPLPGLHATIVPLRGSAVRFFPREKI